MLKISFRGKTLHAIAVAVIASMSLEPVYASGDFDPRPPSDPEYHYYYQLTTKVSPEGAGWASGTGKYEAGSTVWLNASGNYGYVFSHWEKDGEFYSDKQSCNYKTGDEKPVFVAVFDYNPNAPSEPQNNYEPKKRLYLTCNQTGCSFNRTSGEKAVIGKNTYVAAYLDNGYRVTGWYIGDSLVTTSTGFSYLMPDHDVTLRVEIEYDPSAPIEPTSQGGDIAMEADNLDDIDPYVSNTLFYFEKTSFKYTGNPLVLGYYSRFSPEVNFEGELGTDVGSYSVMLDVTIKLDSVNETHRNIKFDYTIEPAELTVSAETYTKVYGDENPEITFTYSGFVNGEDESVLTDSVVYSTSAGITSGVGSYAISLSGGAAKNYKLKYVSGLIKIITAPLTVTPKDVEVTYGTSLKNYAFEYTVEGFKNNDSLNVLTAKPTVKAPASAYVAGTYDLTASGARAANYNFIYETGTLTISKAPLTITPADISVVYGTDLSTVRMSYSYDGFVNGETASVLTKKPALVIPDSISGVGEYAFEISGAEANNYSISYVNGVLTITPATLTVTANDAEYDEGTAEFAFTYTITGFKNGEDESVLTKKPELTCDADAESGAGEYVITVSGAEAANYVFEYVNGKLNLLDTGVIGIEAGGTYEVYDLLGRKVGTTTDELKPGLYIINNRKVYIE